jgi:hypothetical protein
MKSMRSVVLACVVFHNMVVMERKHRYAGMRVVELGGRELPSGVVRINTAPQTVIAHAQVAHRGRPGGEPSRPSASKRRVDGPYLGEEGRSS